MKVNNLLYLTDNMIYLKNKKRKEIIKHKINKNIIKFGKIYNIEKFLKEYNIFLNKYHLNNNLFGDTIKVIINPAYTPADMKILKTSLEKLNYRKITFECESKRYKLNNIKAFLNIQENYLILSYIDEYKKTNSTLIPSNFFLKNEDLLKYLKDKIQNKELYLIGKSDLLLEIFNNFEKKYNNKTYIYNNHELFLLDSMCK